MVQNEFFKDTIEIEFEQIVIWITEIEQRSVTAFGDEKHKL